MFIEVFLSVCMCVFVCVQRNGESPAVFTNLLSIAAEAAQNGTTVELHAGLYYYIVCSLYFCWLANLLGLPKLTINLPINR